MTPDELQDWLDHGARRWRAAVGPDLLDGYATLVWYERPAIPIHPPTPKESDTQ